jgi:hypothetical protein
LKDITCYRLRIPVEINAGCVNAGRCGNAQASWMTGTAALRIGDFFKIDDASN